MRFSPRLHGALVRATWDADDGRVAIAEVWRRVGRFAEQSGLTRPSYGSVRAIVRRERARRAAMKDELLTALDEATQRVPDGLRVLDHLWAASQLRRPSRLRSLVRACVDSTQPPRPPPAV